ncbi:hypothetical protein LRS74_07800 [Streptomyces sp. LX-29]|uniref:hypothetical protein n=1 Tax=Streptomyces sp. LX-29 TaxID=2900152 RepID=UPI00240DC5BE|nr:hypothetical protein [Streptomyces sp. LX-29]WFB06962.1 hypothetical protein LRS74_07800 [Streptomyces sp. LX-29]
MSTPTPAIVCPYCLDPIAFDPEELYARNEFEQYTRVDLSAEWHPVRRRDALRATFQRCTGSPDMDEHYLPTPYLTHGDPLTIAMVGGSAAGKTHLLASMIGEVERGGLEPYGLSCTPLHADSHRAFLKDRVRPLREGSVLAHTEDVDFAEFADGLLISGGGVTRPVMFFDLSGEDLERTDRVTRFLAAVHALVFVVDPLRALPLRYLDPVRSRTDMRQDDLGDQAFAAVLDRMPRRGSYIDAATTVVIGKSDLVRFEEPVARWLGAPELPAALTAAALRAESRDAYAFLRHHGGPGWLRPFHDSARCTLHFASATGGQDAAGGFPQGVRPRRVLTPLLSLFAMCGLLRSTVSWRERAEVGL